jgi:hypothetical protein
MAELAAGDTGERTPLLCLLAASLPGQKDRAADVLARYAAARPEGYSPELAYWVIQTAILCPASEALQKESVFAAAHMLGRIPECGGIAGDPADSGLALYTLSQMRKLKWWRDIGGANAAKQGRAMLPMLQAMTPSELQRLAREMGTPGSKAPRRDFQNAVRLKGKQGLPFSADLLKYAVDADGGLPSRDGLLAAGAFLLVRCEAAQAPRRAGAVPRP